ncbi:MAG: 4-vinyl reductase, partial [Candidatus Bathyarchaeia archaeon]
RDATMWRKHLPNIDVKTLVSFLPVSNLVTGWGKVTEVSLDPTVSECKIKFENCFEAEAILKAYGKRDNAQCYIMDGYLKALFSEITGKICHVMETQCKVKGDALCEFQITLK